MGVIKNIVFDVGMVLVDFRWRDYMLDIGIAPELQEPFGERMVKSDFWKDLDRGTEREDEAPSYFKSQMPEYETEIDLFWKDMTDIVREFDYAAPWIHMLKQAGYRVYLLSNYPPKLADLHWNRFSFLPELDGMIVSGHEKMVKPEENIYRLLFERYGLKPEECIFIDDRDDNIRTAESLGMRGIVFKNYEQAAAALRDAGVIF